MRTLARKRSNIYKKYKYLFGMFKANTIVKTPKGIGNVLSVTQNGWHTVQIGSDTFKFRTKELEKVEEVKVEEVKEAIYDKKGRKIIKISIKHAIKHIINTIINNWEDDEQLYVMYQNVRNNNIFIINNSKVVCEIINEEEEEMDPDYFHEIFKDIIINILSHFKNLNLLNIKYYVEDDERGSDMFYILKNSNIDTIGQIKIDTRDHDYDYDYNNDDNTIDNPNLYVADEKGNYYKIKDFYYYEHLGKNYKEPVEIHQTFISYHSGVEFLLDAYFMIDEELIPINSYIFIATLDKFSKQKVITPDFVNKQLKKYGFTDKEIDLLKILDNQETYIKYEVGKDDTFAKAFLENFTDSIEIKRYPLYSQSKSAKFLA